MIRVYNHKNCQSLFGYAQGVHERSGGICQLCGCGQGPAADFDLWRQMTVEHVIPESLGGSLRGIKAALELRFPDVPENKRQRMAERIGKANFVTSCQFCNSVTSGRQDKKPWGRVRMGDLIREATGSPEEAVEGVIYGISELLIKKREDVRWKLDSVRQAFQKEVEPRLLDARRDMETDS